MRQQQYLKVIWEDFFKIVERYQATDSQRPINPKKNIYNKTTLRYTIPKLLKANDDKKMLKARHSAFKWAIIRLMSGFSIEIKKVKLSL